MQFLYYLAGVSRDDLIRGETLNRDVLKRFHLNDTLRDVITTPEHVVVTPCSEGPDKLPGMCLCPVPRCGDLPKNPAFDRRLKWSKSPRTDAYIGFHIDDLPKPIDLERRRLFAGYEITSRHGATWGIPCARGHINHLATGSLLSEWVPTDDPKKYDLRVLSEHARLWERATIVHDHYNAVARAAANDIVDIVVDSMGLNYRVGPWELRMLAEAGRGVLDVDFILNASLALIDFNAPDDYVALKKTLDLPQARSGSGSRPGVPA